MIWMYYDNVPMIWIRTVSKESREEKTNTLKIVNYGEKKSLKYVYYIILNLIII